METTRTAHQKLQEMLELSRQASKERDESIRKMPELDQKVVIDGCVAQMRRSSRGVAHLILPLIMVTWVMQIMMHWNDSGYASNEKLLCIGGFMVYLMCSWVLSKNSLGPMLNANKTLMNYGCSPIHNEEASHPFHAWLYSNNSGEHILKQIASDIVLKENIGAAFEYGSLGILVLIAGAPMFIDSFPMISFLHLLPFAVLFVRERFIREIVRHEFSNR